MGEAVAGEQVGQARCQVGIGGGVRVVVFGGLVQRLRADEGGEVGVLAVDQREQAALGQLGLAPVADGDFRGAFLVHAAVVGGEGVQRQVFHRPARLDAPDARAPAVQLVRAVDVGGHGIGCVGPGVFAVVSAGGVFLEVELFHRIGLGAIGRARQEAGHAQAQVLGVVRLAQAAPGGVFGGAEDLGQVARVGQFLPRFHLHQRRAGAGDEGSMGRGGDLGHLAQQFHVGRALVEVVVAHDGAEGFAAELAVLFLVDLLEQRALVPGRALEALEGFAQFLLGDVHHPDLQVLVRLGVVHHVVQAAPGAFEFLEVGVVQDQVDLL